MSTDDSTDGTPVKRSFRLTVKGHSTAIEVAEMFDGAIGVALCTEREGLEPLTTMLYVRPKTLRLLTEALSRAAHDPSVWRAGEPHDLAEKE